MFWNPVTRWLACKANSISSLTPLPPRGIDDRRKILLVHAHPREDSFNAAVAAAVEAGAKDGGHEVRRRNLYAEGYQPALSSDERALYHSAIDQGLQRARPDVRAAIEDLRWCDSVVFVYPTWWFNLPGMLKGWLDRTLLPGDDCAWNFPGPGESGGLVPKLTNVKQMAGVTTYGASWPMTLLAGDNGRNCLATPIRHGNFGSDCTCRWLALHNMDFTAERERKDFLDRVYRVFRDEF